MKTLTNESRTTQMYGTQRTHGEGHTEQTVPMLRMRTLPDGRMKFTSRGVARQGQSQQDWNQAEQELQNERLATSQTAKTQSAFKDRLVEIGF